MPIETKPLTDHVGIEILGVGADDLQNGAIAAELDRLLAQHGVLVFREIHVDDKAQVGFSTFLGEVQTFPGATGEYPEIFLVTLDPTKNKAAEYLRGTFFWHLDGSSDPIPNKATMLAAKAVASDGGETEFCSTYVAYDTLPQATKHKIEALRVAHSVGASQLLVHPDPSPEQREVFSRLPLREQPLVWTHADGRKSLVLGATASHVVGWDQADSDALLHELTEWSTQESRVYQHIWSVGDLVIWDNRGTMHRAVPYAVDSPRIMHRTTIFGDEAFN